jgi:hypothetical protein
LDFDSTIAYRPDSSPVSTGYNHPDSIRNQTSIPFYPNSLYNFAVSSHLHTSPSPSVPARLNKPQSFQDTSPNISNSHFTAARPPQELVLHRTQSPSTPYSANATQFPLHPSYNPTASPTASTHERWATSENQFIHT